MTNVVTLSGTELEPGPGKWKCVYCWRALMFKTKKEKPK